MEQKEQEIKVEETQQETKQITPEQDDKNIVKIDMFELYEKQQDMIDNINKQLIELKERAQNKDINDEDIELKI